MLPKWWRRWFLLLIRRVNVDGSVILHFLSILIMFLCCNIPSWNIFGWCSCRSSRYSCCCSRCYSDLIDAVVKTLCIVALLPPPGDVWDVMLFWRKIISEIAQPKMLIRNFAFFLSDLHCTGSVSCRRDSVHFMAGWCERRPESGSSFVRFSLAYVSSFHEFLSMFFVLSFGCSYICFVSNWLGRLVFFAPPGRLSPNDLGWRFGLVVTRWPRST